MTRYIFIFLGTFVVGALIALTVRTAAHRPHASSTEVVASKSPTATPAATMASTPASANTHAHTAPSSAKPVNTKCAICGMDVDPKLPTEEYKGQRIGFGCKMCPPKFRAEPDKYGPYYLRNEVIKP